MDWFERLTGFKERDWQATRSRLAVEGQDLVSLVSGQRYGIGEFELVSLRELRGRLAESPAAPGAQLAWRSCATTCARCMSNPSSAVPGSRSRRNSTRWR